MNVLSDKVSRLVSHYWTIEATAFAKLPLTQVCIPQNVSSGKVAILCSLLSQVTDREELCALIDASDCFDATSAGTAGVDLSRLLWVRCGKKQGRGKVHGLDIKEKQRARCEERLETRCEERLGTRYEDKLSAGYEERLRNNYEHKLRADYEDMVTIGYETLKYTTQEYKSRTGCQGKPMADHQGRPRAGYEGKSQIKEFRNAGERRMKPLEQAFKAADILIQNGGFGLIAIDLGEVEERLVRKIPLTTWFRFARVIEKQPTALVVFATYPAAQSCAALTLHLKNAEAHWSTEAQGNGHAQVLSELRCEVEVGRVRGHGPKPVQSARQEFCGTPISK
jgi:recombination protein RecA